MAIRELTSQDLELISGGNADSGYEGRGDGRGHYGDGGAPKTCANQVGTNAIIGALTGIRGGPWTALGWAVAAGVSTLVACSDQRTNGGGNNGALAGNNNPNSVNGQCRW